MTLSTDIYVHGTGVTQREVYDKVNDLLDIPAERRVIDGPNEWEWQQGDYRLSNELGQGFPAIVETHANADGSIITPGHDDECAEWAKSDGEPCTWARHIVPPWHVHVDLDTAYSYRDTERGWGCAQLHGWVIAALIDWLAERDCTLHWVNEYAGTLHEGRDGLEAFLGDGAQADAWFKGAALPAILAHAAAEAAER